MSYGKLSHLYMPVKNDMVPMFSSHLGLDQSMVEEIFDAMSTSCEVELLLFSAICSQVSIFSHGYRPMIYLSAVRRDLQGKVQTPSMKLLHDVYVELSMNMAGMRALQAVLAKHDMQLALMHSCGGDITNSGDDAFNVWFKKVADEQLIRTRLDWSGSHTVLDNDDWKLLEKICTIGDFQINLIKGIFLLAEHVYTAYQQRFSLAA